MKTKNIFITGNTMVLLFSFLMLSSFSPAQNKSWVAPESAKQKKNTVVSNEASIAAGKTLYLTHCKSCHGLSGRGDGPKAASLDVTCGDFTKDQFKAETDGEIFWKITEGRDPMPSFKTKLTDEQRWQIINYARTLSEKKK